LHSAAARRLRPAGPEPLRFGVLNDRSRARLVNQGEDALARLLHGYSCNIRVSPTPELLDTNVERPPGTKPGGLSNW